MKIPDKIKIGGHEIEVMQQKVRVSPDQGAYNNYFNLIRLESDKDTPEDNIAECFLHEIIEVINKKNNLNLDHMALTVLSESLFQVLRDNKLIF